MNITEKASFFDPRAIPLELLDSEYIVAVIINDVTGLFEIHYKDGSTKSLPDTTPPPVDTIASLQVSNNILTVIMTNGAVLVVGDVADLSSFDDNTPMGTGLLVEPTTNKYKRVVGAPGSDIVVEETDDGVTLTYTPEVSGSYADTPDGCFDFGSAYLTEWLGTDTYQLSGSDMWVMTTASHGTASPDSVTWFPVDWNGDKLNTLGTVSTDGVMTLTSGQYSVDALFFLATVERYVVRLRDITNGVVLLSSSSLGHRNSSTTVHGNSVPVIGNFYIGGSIDVVFEYFLESSAGASNALGSTVIESGASHHIAAQLDLFKVSDTETVQNLTTPKEGHSYLSDLATLPSASDKPYTYEALSAPGGDGLVPFYSGTQSMIDVVTADNGLMYMIPHTGNAFMVYNPELNETVTLTTAITFPNSLEYGKACYGDGVIYLAPVNSQYFVSIVPKPWPEAGEVIELPIGRQTAANKFRDVVFDPINKKVVYLPQNAAEYLVYDVTSETTATIKPPTTLAGNFKHFTGIYDPITNYVFAMPGSTLALTVIDSLYNNAKYLEDALAVPWGAPGKFAESFVSHDGKLWATPCGALEYMVVDGESCSFYREYFGNQKNTEYKGLGQCGNYGADGRFYLASGHEGVTTHCVDTRTKELTKIPNGEIGGASLAIATSKNGDLYLFPTSGSGVMRRLTFGNTEDIPVSIFTKRT